MDRGADPLLAALFEYDAVVCEMRELVQQSPDAVVDALGLEALEVGSPLDPGVPLCRSVGSTPLTLVPKSGNFGAPDLLVRILERLGPA